MSKNILKILISALVLIAITVGCAIYVNDYYPATLGEDISLEDVRYEGNLIICESEGATKGLIFYPGGKVDHEAYIPLALAIAERGVSVVICEMPLRLAVLDINAADAKKGKVQKGSARK